MQDRRLAAEAAAPHRSLATNCEETRNPRRILGWDSGGYRLRERQGARNDGPDSHPNPATFELRKG
eukprot:3139041-Heterocapsa_arctica.AAC.1